jgi:hypothetical protein
MYQICARLHCYRYILISISMKTLYVWFFVWWFFVRSLQFNPLIPLKSLNYEKLRFYNVVYYDIGIWSGSLILRCQKITTLMALTVSLRPCSWPY